MRKTQPIHHMSVAQTNAIVHSCQSHKYIFAQSVWKQRLNDGPRLRTHVSTDFPAFLQIFDSAGSLLECETPSPTDTPTAVPTDAPSTAPSSLAPTTRSPTTLAPTTLAPTQSPVPPKVIVVQNNTVTNLTNNQDNNSDASSGGGISVAIIIVIVVIIIICVLILLCYCRAKRKARELKGELVGESFMMNPAFGTIVPKSGTVKSPAANINQSKKKKKSTSAPEATYLQPTPSKKVAVAADPPSMYDKMKLATTAVKTNTLKSPQPASVQYDLVADHTTTDPTLQRSVKKPSAPLYQNPNKTKKKRSDIPSAKIVHIAGPTPPALKGKTTTLPNDDFDPDFYDTGADILVSALEANGGDGYLDIDDKAEPTSIYEHAGQTDELYDADTLPGHKEQSDAMDDMEEYGFGIPTDFQ
eukprot:m.462572 g.462572  ORF g.462572 m.462572 type:complete len:414 (+) comp21604_c0_seq4:210-1451(+)